MKKTTITMEDINFCKYAVMFKKDSFINDDYAVALFSTADDAERYMTEIYPKDIILKGDIYIAETTLK